jgi:ribose/xylose/arabinose/galactoside ABC-type transport system permease subunit
MFVLVILMVLFSFASPYFLTFRNLTNIVTQNTYFIVVAIGLSFVMIGGGIDLSVGFQMSLVGSHCHDDGGLSLSVGRRSYLDCCWAPS